jgi:hypothetical protein
VLEICGVARTAGASSLFNPQFTTLISVVPLARFADPSPSRTISRPLCCSDRLSLHRSPGSAQGSFSALVYSAAPVASQPAARLPALPLCLACTITAASGTFWYLWSTVTALPVAVDLLRRLTSQMWTSHPPRWAGSAVAARLNACLLFGGAMPGVMLGGDQVV